MIYLCEKCFPGFALVEVCSIIPFSPCSVCGVFDNRSDILELDVDILEFNMSVVRVHAFPTDPRENILKISNKENRPCQKRK